MPRVITKTKIKLGKERSCGKCGREIKPGDQYRQWSFRYGGTRYRCGRPECAPRQSDLTQSKMAEVYAAIEAAEDQLPEAESAKAIQGLVEGVAETVTEVAQEYAEAAEPFGMQGENQERADELEGWAQDLESFDVEVEDTSDPDHEMHGVEGAQEQALEQARDEAREALGECPL